MDEQRDSDSTGTNGTTWTEGTGPSTRKASMGMKQGDCRSGRDRPMGGNGIVGATEIRSSLRARSARDRHRADRRPSPHWIAGRYDPPKSLARTFSEPRARRKGIRQLNRSRPAERGRKSPCKGPLPRRKGSVAFRRVVPGDCQWGDGLRSEGDGCVWAERTLRSSLPVARSLDGVDRYSNASGGMKRG